MHYQRPNIVKEMIKRRLKWVDNDHHKQVFLVNQVIQENHLINDH